MLLEEWNDNDIWQTRYVILLSSLRVMRLKLKTLARDTNTKACKDRTKEKQFSRAAVMAGDRQMGMRSAAARLNTWQL